MILTAIRSGKLTSPAQPDLLPLLSDSLVVAKVFDPDFMANALSDGEWQGSAIDYCGHLACNEESAYTKLGSMNGVELPIFYGTYKSGDSYIILEYLTSPSLYQYLVHSPEESAALCLAAYSLIEKIQLKGVYHRDIEPSNLLWEPSLCELKNFDFEFSSSEDGKSEAVFRRWAKRDKAEIRGILVDCGAEEPLPAPVWLFPPVIKLPPEPPEKPQSFV